MNVDMHDGGGGRRCDVTRQQIFEMIERTY